MELVLLLQFKMKNIFKSVPIAPQDLRILLAKGRIASAEMFRLVYKILLNTAPDYCTTMENKKVSHRPIPSYRGRCFTVRFGRDGAAVESGVKCTGEMGKNRFFCIYAKTVLSSGCQGINYYSYVYFSQSSLNKKVQLKEIQ